MRNVVLYPYMGYEKGWPEGGGPWISKNIWDLTPPHFYSTQSFWEHARMVRAVKSRIISHKPSRDQISCYKSMKIAKMEVPVISHKLQEHAIILRTRAYIICPKWPLKGGFKGGLRLVKGFQSDLQSEVSDWNYAIFDSETLVEKERERESVCVCVCVCEEIIPRRQLTPWC